MAGYGTELADAVKDLPGCRWWADRRGDPVTRPSLDAVTVGQAFHRQRPAGMRARDADVDGPENGRLECQARGSGVEVNAIRPEDRRRGPAGHGRGDG
jgi:hypothetical protein